MVAVAIARRAHVAAHQVAVPQRKATDLRLGNVHVVRAALPAGVAAQEAEALVHDLQVPLEEHGSVLLGPGLQDHVDQGVLGQIG